MPVCPSCKAEGYAPGSPCRACGKTSAPGASPALPDFELNMPAPQARRVAPKQEAQVAVPLELAVDLDAMRNRPSHGADALVALGERASEKASGAPEYTRALGELKASEDLVRSRDHSLAKEQDAHAERIASIDGRISRLESELASALEEERRAAEEL